MALPKAALQREIRAVYQEVNPEKLSSGEVDRLLQKYRGQERLLLRRVQFRYGLVVLSGRLWRRDDGLTWRLVRASLRADGLLRWSFENPAGSRTDGDDMDVRMCAVDEWDTAAAGRPLAFAVFATNESDVEAVLGGDPGSACGSSLVAAAETSDDKRRWVEALRETNDFFEKLRYERKCQKEEEQNELEALRESEREFKLEQERRLHAEMQQAIDTLRAAAISRIESQAPKGIGSIEEKCELTPAELTAKLGAELETALDDALFATSTASDAAAAGDTRAAHRAYCEAVAALVEAKVRIEQMGPEERPEEQVLLFIDSRSEQCKSAADGLWQRHKQRLRAQVGKTKASPALHEFDNAPRLDMPRAIPAALEKLVLDADDL